MTEISKTWFTLQLHSILSSDQLLETFFFFRFLIQQLRFVEYNGTYSMKKNINPQ